MTSLPPVLYHYFSTPLPYARTLSAQEQLHSIQLAQRRHAGHHRDLLLLLQHRPVYTAGRRQLSTSPEVEAEATRLRTLGADFVTTQRGGQTTYHGPGQIVGYPLLDLGRWSPPMGIRTYICKMQKTLKAHLLEAHGIQPGESEHTGVFLDDTTKIASIGVQVRHRLTTHGFSMNITRNPRAWFDRVVACGLADVKAGCIADASQKKHRSEVAVGDEVIGLVERFGRELGRDMQSLNSENAGDEIMQVIRQLEEDAITVGAWQSEPAQ